MEGEHTQWWYIVCLCKFRTFEHVSCICNAVQISKSLYCSLSYLQDAYVVWSQNFCVVVVSGFSILKAQMNDGFSGLVLAFFSTFKDQHMYIFRRDKYLEPSEVCGVLAVSLDFPRKLTSSKLNITFLPHSLHLQSIQIQLFIQIFLGILNCLMS